MQMNHPGLSKEQIVHQVQSAPEHSKRIKVEGRLAHKSPVAIAFEKAVEKANS